MLGFVPDPPAPEAGAGQSTGSSSACPSQLPCDPFLQSPGFPSSSLTPHAQSFSRDPKVGYLQSPLRKLGFQIIFRNGRGSNWCVHLRKMLRGSGPVELAPRVGHPASFVPGGGPSLLSRKTWPVGRTESFTWEE